MNAEGRVIVSVRRSDSGEFTDFALAIDRPVNELGTIIAEAQGWARPFEVFADPPGRLLRPTETLAEAGVWDGAALIMQVPGDAVSVAGTVAEAQPIYTWKRIDGS